MKKRILSLALALTLALALVPFAVAADVSPHPHTTVPAFPHDNDVKNFSISAFPAGDYVYEQIETGGEIYKTWEFTNNTTYMAYAKANVLEMLVFKDGWVYFVLYEDDGKTISGTMKYLIGNIDLLSLNAEDALGFFEGMDSIEMLSAMNLYAIVETPDGLIELFPDGCMNMKLADGTTLNIPAEVTASAIETPAITLPEQIPAPVSALVAAPNASAIVVDGEIVSFDAYTINSENYIKLRDVAYTLNGTRVQFNVSYDGMINITSGTAYTPDGSEMKSKGTANKTPVLNKAKIMLNGKEVELTAYTIDGNNYFKLRELAQTFDFGVGWDGSTSTITVDTSVPYTP